VHSPPTKNASDENVRNSERYSALIGSIDEGFCVIEVLFDAEGRACDYRFLETNAAFARHTGLVDVEGKRMRELAPAHEEHWFEFYGRVAMTGEPGRFMQEARALGDRWYEVHAFRVDQPELRRVAVLFNEVSERVRGEQNTRLLGEISQDLVRVEGEENLAKVIGPKLAAHFSLSQCAFVELDLQRNIARIDNCWHQPDVPSVAGTYPLKEFVTPQLLQEARTGSMLVVRDVSHDSRIAHPGRFDESSIGSFVMVPLMRSGEWRYSLMLYRREASEWRGDQLDLAREVASRCWARLERLRAERALRASEERLRLIMDNAREYAIFSADMDRRIISWNAGAERLLGYAEAEVVGRSGDIIFTPEDRHDGAPEREAAIALRDGRATNERWHVRKDGTRFWGSGAMMVMRDHHGPPLGLLKIMRDQTEEQETKQALEQSQAELMAALRSAEQAGAEAVAAGRAKDQFLATLSHELRTPLNPVLMIASEAVADPTLSPQVRSDFEVVRQNIELEARLIEDMLDISRITQGKLSLRREDVDLHQILRETVEMTRPGSAEKEIVPALKLNAMRSHVYGDPARLKQVFVNLLNNAIKFTPVAGSVVVETMNAEDKEEITVKVSDTGIGLTPDELTRVFHAFAQGSHAEEGGSLYGGLGLGLAIVETLVVKHGGHVTATSPGRGLGATFTVDLPLGSGSTHRADTSGGGSGHPMSVPKWRILLVEDHAHTRVALERMLIRRGHAVTVAGSKAEAHEAASRQTFDLLVSDIGLPDGDGYQLIGELRAVQTGLTGIALSGYGMENDVRRSSEAGFVAHLVKPVSVSKLDALMSDLRSLI
jgi:PAS domain S-box-containing protein